MSVEPSVSVIGLGRMGSALAGALLRAGRSVTVYNRTVARCTPLQDQGATVAETPAGALAASRISLISLADYDAATTLVFGAGTPDLRGKALIQLSSGTPGEARAWFRRCEEREGEALTGAILAYPMHIGTPRAQLLISGRSALYTECYKCLELLGTPVHVGEEPGGASALDCAALASSMLSILGFVQGIELCRSEGVDPGKLVTLSNASAAGRAQLNQMIERAIATESFANPQATIETWAAVAGHVAHIVAANRMAPDLSGVLVGLFARAREAGFGTQDISALAKLLRAPANANVD